MNRLWVKLSLAFIVAYIITWITAILLILIASESDFSSNEDDMLSPDPMDYYFELQDAIYEGDVDEFKDELLLAYDEMVTDTIEHLEGEGFREGKRPVSAAGDEIRDILIHVVTPLVLVIFIVSGIVGSIMGLVLSRSFTSPLKNLLDATKLVGERNLEVTVPASGALEFRELAESFNKMTEELKISEQREKNFSADIAHELRTPLSVLEGNLRASLDHVNELDEESIAKLYSQTGHLIRLVKDLRQLSMAESHQLPISFADFNLNSLIREVVDIFSYTAEECHISITFELPSESIKLNADESRIRQVLHNLIENAFRHTPEGGTISISGSICMDSVVISVTDSGEGIEEDQLENIFKRLYRTDRARSRVKGGTGLGLSIVKAIITNHGGYVRAESPGLGQGATFIVILPV